MKSVLTLVFTALVLASCGQTTCPPLVPCGAPSEKFVRKPGCTLGEQVIGPNGEPDSCWAVNPCWEGLK